jgi:hypothetical protein
MACVNIMCWFNKLRPSATFCRPDADAGKERGHQPSLFLIVTATVTTKDDNMDEISPPISRNWNYPTDLHRPLLKVRNDYSVRSMPVLLLLFLSSRVLILLVVDSFAMKELQ